MGQASIHVMITIKRHDLAELLYCRLNKPLDCRSCPLKLTNGAVDIIYLHGMSVS